MEDDGALVVVVVVVVRMVLMIATRHWARRRGALWRQRRDDDDDGVRVMMADVMRPLCPGAPPGCRRAGCLRTEAVRAAHRCDCFGGF